MKKFWFILMTIPILAGGLTACNRSPGNGSIGIIGGSDGPTAIFVSPGKQLPAKKAITIERVVASSDKDQDGLNDTDDIIEGASIDAENKPRYKDGYYSGGYPPDNEGVCTDVIWRAFRNAGYNLKDLVDEDIQYNI